MGITVKNMPKKIEVPEPEPGDVIICDEGAAWIFTTDDNIVALEGGDVVDFSDIRVAKIFKNCLLTLA